MFSLQGKGQLSLTEKDVTYLLYLGYYRNVEVVTYPASHYISQCLILMAAFKILTILTESSKVYCMNTWCHNLMIPLDSAHCLIPQNNIG